MSPPVNKKTFLGSIAGRILAAFSRKPKAEPKDVKKIDFETSTQKMGVRFTEKIRNVFRFRWIKKN